MKVPRRRILHVIPTLGEAGAERQLSYLAAALGRRDWEVHVAVRIMGPNAQRLADAGIAVHVIPAISNYDPISIVHLHMVIREVQPALIQTWIMQSDLLGGGVAQLCGIPWILSERSSGEAYGQAGKHRARARLARRARAIVSNSHSGNSYWAGMVGDAVPRYVIPNALPLEEIASAPLLEPADWRPPGRPLIASVGRLMRVPKNTHGFVLGLRAVIPRTDARAIICGEGPARGEIESLIDLFGMQANVRLAGTALKVWSVLKTADVLVAASFYEGNPNAVLEAMASGCPLVVSDIPAHRELLDETTALFVDPTSPTSIGEGVLAVLRDPDAARCRSIKARGRVAELTIEQMASQYEGVYEDVLAGSSREHSRN
ncbi:MAG: glycosyltransferase [Gemmatimonadota bacterium]